MFPVTLIQKETDEISITLTAEINSKGELVLSGQDLGPRVKELWGDIDYEYWTTVSSDQKRKVVVQLLDDAFDSLHDLHSWLRAAGIGCTPMVRDTGGENFRMETNKGQISVHTELAPNRDDVEDPVFIIGRKDEEKLLLLILQEMFKRQVFENDSEFKNWLEKHDIEHKFSSYA